MEEYQRKSATIMINGREKKRQKDLKSTPREGLVKRNTYTKKTMKVRGTIGG